MANCFNVGSDLGQNLGLGFLNFFGLGDAIKGLTGWKTPGDQVKDKISSLHEATDAFRNQANLELWKGQNEINTELFHAITLGNDDLNQSLQYYDELLSEDISINKVYIFFLYIFFILIYLFIMIRL